MIHALSLTTSSSQGSIALGTLSGGLLDQVMWIKAKSHSEKLTPELESLLHKNQWKLSQLQWLFTTKGPGSFTGIRVGLSVIKTLAHSHDIPIIALEDTFAIALNSDPTESLPLLSLVDAQKNKVFLGLNQWSQGELKTLEPAQLVDLEKIESYLPKGPCVCLGDAYEIYKAHLSPTLISHLIRKPEVSDFPCADQMLKYLLPRTDQFPKVTGLELQAYYLRDSAAEEVRRARLGK